MVVNRLKQEYYGPKEPGCIVVTSGGRHGKNAGYGDERLPDGSWIYFGQGQNGDQKPNKYANQLLVRGDLSILLFTTREPNSLETKKVGSHKKRYRYEGVFGVLDWEYFVPQSGKRKGDNLLRFHLIPNHLNDYYDIDESHEIDYKSIDINTIRNSLLLNNTNPVKVNTTLQEYKLRSQEIKQYTKLRAKGICEFCSNPAPFEGLDGLPFLEVHHMHRLADDGPDSIFNVIALCPNCHREVHYGLRKEKINNQMITVIARKEDSFMG